MYKKSIILLSVLIIVIITILLLLKHNNIDKQSKLENNISITNNQKINNNNITIDEFNRKQENESIQNIANSSEIENNIEVNEMISEILIEVNGKILNLILENNQATRALVEKLKSGNVSVNASDYGGFEKTGSLGFSLPREDTQISTLSGDLVLYKGNQISLFYSSHSWSYTKLGKVSNVSNKELKNILGDSDVTLVFKLK